MRAAFESAGDIRSVDLLAALVSIWRAKESGSLRFSRPGATAGFELLGGEVVLSLSSQPRYDTAAILSRAGKLEGAALEKLREPSGGDAALAALQAGLISAKEWRWGQKIRAIEILSDLLGWLEGEYSFDTQARPAAGDWTLPVPRLVLELFLRSRDRPLVEHYLGPSDLPLLRAGSFDEEFEMFGLTSDAADVVALIDGRASAEEIAERAPAEEFAVLKLLAALTTLGLVHPAEAAPEPRHEAPTPIRPGAEEPEVAREAEPEPEPERASRLEAGDEIEPEPEAPAGPVEQLPEEPEAEFAPQAEEETPPAAEMGIGEETPEPAREPATEPPALEPRVPADLMPERLELSFPTEGQGENFEPGFPASPDEAPPPDAAKPRSGALLAGLLVVLVLAVAALLIVRSRRASPEGAVAVNVRPTAQEPVFPPAETAVPLPTHGTRAVRPSPVFTRLAAIPPTAAPTVPSRPTLPPTPIPTRTEPTRPPTPVPTRAQPTPPPTRIPTRPAPTRPPTPVPTRAQPTPPPTRIPTRPVPTRPPTRVPPAAAPTAEAAVRAETTRTAWMARAERDRKALLNRRNVRYAVQLELACETPTLEKAWSWDRPPGTMWLLTTTYRGRTCFRVMWGRFASLPEARDAKARVPEFFTEPGNRPAVVSVR